MNINNDTNISISTWVSRKVALFAVATFLIPARVLFFVFVSISSRTKLRWSAIALFLLVSSISLGIFTSQPTQAVNSYINFQARLLNDTGGLVADGDYHVRFKILCGGDGAVDVTEASDCLHGTNEDDLWTETWTTGNLVRVVNGYMSVELGSLTAFSGIDWTDSPLWLSIEIGGSSGAASWDGELDPHMRLNSVPQAINSENLDGLDSTDFVQLGQGEQTDASANDSIEIDKTSTGNFITLQDAGTTEFLFDQDGTLTLGSATDNGQLVLYDGSSHTGTIVTAALGSNETYTLPDSDGSDTFCLLDLDNCNGGSGSSLQSSYVAGNTITTTDADNGILFNLADTTDDEDFIIDILGTGNTLEVHDAGTAIFTLVDGGAATFQNFTDSTTGFQILDKDGGTSIFVVDTTNETVGIGSTPGADNVFRVGGTLTGSSGALSLTQGTLSSFASSGTVGINGYIDAIPSSENTGGNTYTGLQTQIWGGGTNFTGSSSIRGIKNVAGTENGDTDTLASITGILSDVSLGNSTTVTTTTGLNLGSTINGTTTTNYGLYVENPSVSGTLTNNYAIEILDQTTGTSDYGISIQGADTYALWVGSGADNTDAANGITFGISGDTNLYRSAADTLKTDDSLVVDGGTITLGTSSQAGTIILYDGSSHTGTLQTASLGSNEIYTLPDSDGSDTFCLLNLDNCSGGGGAGQDLQGAYDAGNSITTTNANDIDLVLDDTATDSNFDIDVTADNTVSISRLNNAVTEAPAQLLLVENLDTNLTIANGILITDAGGVITDGLDVSDADIVNGINIGVNTLLGTTGAIDYTNFDVSTGGAITALSYGGITEANLLDLTATETISGVYSFTNSAGIDLGVASTTTGQITLFNSGSAQELILQSASIATADRTVTFPDPGGNDTVCLLTLANCAGGGGLFTDDTGFTYLTDTAEDLVIGGTTVGAADIFLGDDGSAQFNVQGADVDFNIEASGVANALFVQGSDGFVGIGDATPSSLFTVGAGDLFTVDSSGDVGFAAGTQTIAGIQNQNLLDKTATETISGAYSFTNAAGIDLGVASTTTGQITLFNSGSGNELILVSASIATASRTVTIPDPGGADTVCLLTLDNCAGGGGAGQDLQGAYDAGNTILTTDASDIAITLDDTTTDSDFTITVADDSTSTTVISRADGAGTADPAQLLLIDNLDATRSIADGIKVQAAAGTIVDGIDVSDAELTNGVNLGANVLLGTGGAVINFDNFDVSSAGAITALSYGGITEANLLDKSATETISGAYSFTNSAGIDLGVASSTTGQITLFNSGSANELIVQSASIATTDRTVTIPDPGGADTFCLLTLDNCAGGGGAGQDLQGAYDAGGTILTTDAKDIAFTLDDTATDSDFTITVADDSTSTTTISRADGAGTADPAQLLLIDNLDATRSIADGIKVQAAAGTIVDGLDVSDAELTNGVNLGANILLGTGGAVINFDNFDVDASGNATLIDLAVNGGDLTTTQTTFNLVNATATTLNIGGAATTLELGAATGTTSVNNNLTVDGNTTLGSASTDLITFTGTVQGATVLIFEGATADAYEFTLTVTDPTADVTYNFADAVAGTYDICTTVGNCVGLSGNNGAIEHYSARRTSELTTTSSGWNAVTGGSADSGTTASTNGWIDSANLTVGEDYLIMVWGSHGVDDIDEQSGIRVKHGSTVFDNSQTLEEADESTYTDYKNPYAWFTVWTAVSGEDIELEFYNSDISSSEAAVQDISLLAINAEDLVSDGDLQYDIDTTGGALTGTPTAGAEIIWTPSNASDSWWINGYMLGDSTASNYHSLQIDIDGTDYSSARNEGEDDVGTDNPMHSIGWVEPLSAASHTIGLELFEEEGDMEWLGAGIMALRLDRFEDFVEYSVTGDGASLSSDDTWFEQAGLDPTVTTQGDWVIAAGGIADDNTDNLQLRVELADSTIAGGNGTSGSSVFDSTDLQSIVNADVQIDLSTGAKDFDVDGRTANATSEFEDVWAVAFSLEQNSSGGSGGGSSEWTDGGTFLFPSDASGAEDIAIGGTTLAGADIILLATGGATFNEQGADVDFNIEASGVANALFVQGSDGFVGVGDATPDAQLDVDIAAAGSIGFQVQGAASQTADMLLLLNSGAAELLSIEDDGTTTFKVDTDSVGAFVVQEAGGEAYLTVDTESATDVLQVRIGAGTDDVVFAVDAFTTDPTGSIPDGAMFYDSDGDIFRCRINGSWADCDTTGGGGSSTIHVSLIPEFAGGTFTADGSDNSGTLTSDYDSSNRHSYYEWGTSQTEIQDYDIIVRYQLPSDFSSFTAGSLDAWGYSGDTTKTTLTIAAIDSGGTTCFAAESIEPGSNDTWAQDTTITDLDDSCTLSADEIVTFTIRVSAEDDEIIRIGEIEFEYDT